MPLTISFLRSVIAVACPAAGLAGCLADAAVPAPDTDDCPARSFRIASVEVPITAGDAIGVGFDLDGDGVRDNWLGFANTVLHAWSPAWDLAPVVAGRLGADVEWTLEVRQCAASGAATAVLRSSDEMDVVPARGDRGAAPLTGGTFGLPLGALSDALGGAPVGWVHAPMAHLRLDAIDDATVDATVDVAVAVDDVIALVAPNLAAYFTARLAVGDSDFALAADTDGDRVVTADELMASAAARVLLAPDLEDRLELGGDGFSLGFRVVGAR